MKNKRSCANCGHRVESHYNEGCAHAERNEVMCLCNGYRERPSRAKRIRNLVEYASWAIKHGLEAKTTAISDILMRTGDER